MKKACNIFCLMYFIISAILLVILLIPIDNIKIKNDKIKILNRDKTVRIGEKVRYEVDYVKQYNLPSLLSKGLEIRGMYIILKTPPALTSIEPGKHVIIASMVVPNSDFLVGKAKLVFKIEYKIFGGMRTLYDQVESEEFKIMR